MLTSNVIGVVVKGCLMMMVDDDDVPMCLLCLCSDGFTHWSLTGSTVTDEDTFMGFSDGLSQSGAHSHRTQNNFVYKNND